jgi:hypothetical protein
MARRSQRIAVAGGAGFLGGNVQEQLKAGRANPGRFFYANRATGLHLIEQDCLMGLGVFRLPRWVGLRKGPAAGD